MQVIVTALKIRLRAGKASCQDLLFIPIEILAKLPGNPKTVVNSNGIQKNQKALKAQEEKTP
jgi:hypothetical protein